MTFSVRARVHYERSRPSHGGATLTERRWVTDRCSRQRCRTPRAPPSAREVHLALRMDADVSGSAAAPTVVRSFVRRFRTEILAEWKAAARAISAAKELSTIVLVDHMPELLDELAELADEIAAARPCDKTLETARRHAIDRLADGFGVTAVVAELSLLRRCILGLWMRENRGAAGGELVAIDMAIDRAIAVSVGRYAEVRDRTVAGIDRISTASLESRDLDELLGRLLKVFMDTTPAVDTAAILLLENGRLRLRAAVGLEEALAADFEVPIGEGFAGTIAADRKPRSLRAAYLDPIVRSDVLRAKHIHALYGIPLIQGDELIGVAHMGSLTADEFSEEDRHFFASMTSRATIGIRHHVMQQELADIAEERERALAKLESLLAASPVATGFVDRDLRYLRVNPALAALNGRTVDEHVGRSIREILQEHAAGLEPLLRQVLETGQPILNLPLEHPDGRSFLANYFPVRNSAHQVTGVGAIILDVSDEKRAQEQLHTERARLQSILEHAPTAIWLKDADGRIVLANERLAEALGTPLDALIGHRSAEVLPHEIAEQHEAHDRVVLHENRAIEVEELAPSANGVRTFLSVKFPIPGAPPLVGAIATEITERKRMEDELRAAVRAREEILAIVSHDLRSPLSTVQLSVSTLRMENAPDNRSRRLLDMIDRASQRMQTLIEDLLDIANIRAGRLVLELKRESVADVVKESLDLLQPTAEERGIELMRVCDVGHAEINCDRDRVLQVFGNLIGNAIKFCRSGDTITVTCQRERDDVRFCVADTGPGIRPELLPFLFEAYWSANEHTKSGTGLGLYICRGIVEGHGGRIWAESEPGQGARFFFTLPLAEPST